MTKIETKQKKQDTEEAEEFNTHGGKQDEYEDRSIIREGNSKNNKRQG